MKIKIKLLPILICCTLVFNTASCGNVKKHNKPNKKIAQLISNYNGWYAGAGLSYQSTNSEALLDDNAGRMTGGRGISAHDLSLVKSHAKKFGVSLLAGYGKLFSEKLYFGAEINFDITGNCKHTSTDPESYYGNSTLETKGSVPTLAFRLGGVFPSKQYMIYGRFGVVFWENKFESLAFKNQGFSSKKIVPILGLGIEAMRFNKLSIRFEGDYRFSADKTKSRLTAYNEDGTVYADGYSGSIKNKAKGFASRLICVYHFSSDSKSK